MRYTSFFLLFILLQSCASRKNVAYLQDVNNNSNSQTEANYEPVLKNDDLLSIIVSANDPEITYMFNIPQIQGSYKVNENQDGIKTYLIDTKGEIEFPVIGRIKLAGLTRTQAIDKLAEKIKPYITNPTINLRILNYKISVLGEVNKAGNYTINSERITLLEAIANAGDLTIYGRRDNILIIREKDGKKTYNRIDITKSDFINSDFYYLTQNDVVIVEPNKTRVNSSAFGPNITATISALSVIATIILLLTRN
ncbi:MULTISPECIES: polysaccharide biosynthesis/export family protein [Flavobacterium]|jgi:polysaccharide export outer membrane protein|uniref:Polysaccharide biosynthesis/export family protein n=1 Tax=Flavobacterium macrobrachii TaxID=591204 RepID=A0ABS2CZ29_9FLAO|nr:MULTISPECIES: polysaccharide biosynthesis/export family protein [Flavobacterium]MBM6499844.1 polysaccharide biosynthesis/export family protein [Flavobacterium macrobrachii]MCZ8091047.1 polysaccharide biosynthesis/export family protein [Flavobacterium sp.]